MKVECPICFKLMKEINNAHLKAHNLTTSQYDSLYPTHPRMSDEQRKKKARYTVMTKEISDKLKRSQTLEGYIEKYGCEAGERRWKEVCSRKSNSKSLQRYIERFGPEKGKEMYEQYKATSKKKMTLDGFIERYGEDGKVKYEEWLDINRTSKTLEHYIKKYGVCEGNRRWFMKNLRNSKSSMKTDLSERADFKRYRSIVRRLTKVTLKNNPQLPKLNLVKKGVYSVDHKFSILEGFKNNIPPYIIASIHNLEVVTHEENCAKQERCTISLQELFVLLDLNISQ